MYILIQIMTRTVYYRNYLMIVTVLVIVLFGLLSIKTKQTTVIVSAQNEKEKIIGCSKCENQRIEMSKQMNQIMQKYYTLQCQLPGMATDRGSWCAKYMSHGHVKEKWLPDALSLLFTGKTVGSFGEGTGEYKRYIINTGRVLVYDGYDGTPNIENVTNEEVSFLDLTIPHYGLPIYDWIVSIEVAEHIPRQHEATYLDNIFRHAREGIVMSWATPDQTGFNHVNGRPREYVMNKLNVSCFLIDHDRSQELRKKAWLIWLQKNIMVFNRRSDCPINENEA